MYWPDVVDLKQFYSSALGRAACQRLLHGLRAFWPQSRGEVVVGLGYATPYLGFFMQEAERVIACMPMGQGAMYWPAGRRNLTVLVNESHLPLPDHSINRIVLAHVLENSERLGGLLQEVWRVLTPGGRMLVMVPNRRGIWARSGSTPFGYGRPFSASQLKHILLDNQFTPGDSRTVLYMPPNQTNFLLRMAPLFESLGTLIFGGFGGVLLMEAEKQIYATRREKVAVARPQVVYATAPKPVMTRQ